MWVGRGPHSLFPVFSLIILAWLPILPGFFYIYVMRYHHKPVDHAFYSDSIDVSILIILHMLMHIYRAIFPSEFSKWKCNESISAVEKKDLSFNIIKGNYDIFVNALII